MSNELLTAAVTATAAVAGAVAKGAWDYLRGRDTDNATVKTAVIVDAAQIRAELWQELEKLRDRLDDMQDELDKARRGYLELLSQHSTLKAEHNALKFDHDALQKQYAALEAEVVTLRARDHGLAEGGR